MPSILEERQEKGKVIEEDGGLDQFDSSKWIFTDISMGVSDSVSHCETSPHLFTLFLGVPSGCEGAYRNIKGCCLGGD